MRSVRLSISALLCASVAAVAATVADLDFAHPSSSGPPLTLVSRNTSGPTGKYCGNASFLVLYAAIEMSFFDDGDASSPALNVSATVDLLPVVHCTAEPYSYNGSTSDNVTLRGLSNKTDCLSRFVILLGGDPEGVSLTYDSADDTLSASFEGEACVFSRHECHEHPPNRRGEGGRRANRSASSSSLSSSSRRLLTEALGRPASNARA